MRSSVELGVRCQRRPVEVERHVEMALGVLREMKRKRLKFSMLWRCCCRCVDDCRVRNLPIAKSTNDRASTSSDHQGLQSIKKQAGEDGYVRGERGRDKERVDDEVEEIERNNRAG